VEALLEDFEREHCPCESPCILHCVCSQQSHGGMTWIRGGECLTVWWSETKSLQSFVAGPVRPRETLLRRSRVNLGALQLTALHVTVTCMIMSLSVYQPTRVSRRTSSITPIYAAFTSANISWTTPT
jgi:hypothetical protein